MDEETMINNLFRQTLPEISLKEEKINNFLEELDALCHKYNYIKDKDIAQLDNIIIIKLYR